MTSMMMLVIFIFVSLSGTWLDRASGMSLDEEFDGALFPPVEIFRSPKSITFSKQRRVDHRASLSPPLQTKALKDDIGISDCNQIVCSKCSADLKFEFKKRTASDENPANKTDFYEIVNRSANKTFQVGPKKMGSEALQAFQWATTDSGFAFVFNDQVFFSASPTADAERLTVEDGRQHGVFDWVYEEEIFGREEKLGLWWSPSGSMLAFASTDDRGVRKSTFPLYKQGEAYPMQIEFAYPMTGEKKLPEVTLSIWNKDLKELRQLEVQLRDREAFHYLFAVSWVRLHDKEQLVAVWANRWQNEMSLTICEFNTSTCVLSFEYKYEHGSIRMWADPEDFRPILHSDNELFFKLPQLTPGGDLHQHIARLVVPANYLNATRSSLSSGNYDVKKLLSYDSNTSSILFFAKAPRPTQLHLYSTSITPSSAGDSSRCLSCVSSECTYQGVQVCPSGRYARVKCLGPTLGKKLIIDLINGSIDASVKIQVPLNDSLRTMSKVLPVVLHVYGGPGTQAVTERPERDPIVKTFITKGYAVVEIDGRGSDGRGWKLKSTIYGRLGTVEVTDQLEALRLVLDKYNFLDRNRVAVYGWSYGGFASANAVIEDTQRTLKCAVSVAPLEQKCIDATYTERFMGDAPEEAYDASSLTRNVSNFAHTKLLLAHDNVQFVNTALFLEELQKNNITFEQLVYPNLDHDLDHGVKEATNRFLNTCFA